MIMYLAKITFGQIRGDHDDAIDNVQTYLGALRANGQIVGDYLLFDAISVGLFRILVILISTNGSPALVNIRASKRNDDVNKRLDCDVPDGGA
jgi:hypothetical protein